MGFGIVGCVVCLEDCIGAEADAEGVPEADKMQMQMKSQGQRWKR